MCKHYEALQLGQDIDIYGWLNCTHNGDHYSTKGSWSNGKPEWNVDEWIERPLLANLRNGWDA